MNNIKTEGVKKIFGKKKDARLKALDKIKKQEKKENDLVDKKLSNLYKRLEEFKKNMKWNN